jgi:hypothetical protein
MRARFELLARSYQKHRAQSPNKRTVPDVCLCRLFVWSGVCAALLAAAGHPAPPKFVRQRATVVLHKFCVELIGIDRWLREFCGE